MTYPNAIADNPLVYLFRSTWKYSEGNKGKVVLYWIMFIIAESINVIFTPLLGAKMIDVISKQGINDSSVNLLEILLALLFAKVIIFWAFHGPARIFELTNAFKAKINYRRFLTQGVFMLPLEWHTDHHSGDTIDKSEKGTTALNDFSSDSFNFIYCFVRLFICYGMLVYFSHSASYIVIVMMIISAWVTIRFDKVLLEQNIQLNKSENQIAVSISDAIKNISTVIILRVEKLVFNSIMKKVEEPLDLFVRSNKISETKWFIVSMCCAAMHVCVWAMYIIENYGTGPGVLVASSCILLNYINQIGSLFFNFAGMYGYVMKRKTRMMNSEELSKDFISESFSNHVLPKDWKNLEIFSLYFTYPEHDEGRDHLHNVSLSVKRGEKIAFIGERGSGKTTLLKIMRYLAKPRELTLRVDGEIIDSGFEGIHNAITLVQQDTELFAQTIEENVTMGIDYHSDFIRSFTDMACFSNVIDDLPERKDGKDKLQYSLREKGVNLSGGQRQCLALARGLLACHDKEIILLDEPTSSLDTITSITVYRNIFREFNCKTVISTVHQLDLLPLFDRICVFEKGRIVATGTLSELMQTSSKFVSLWEAMKYADVEKFV